MHKHEDFIIIVDTREQQPWSFEHYATANRKLDTGDYSIEGLEDVLCIERKKSINEIANNITESRFRDVVDRMSKFKYAFLLLEFDLSHVMHYPVGSNLPKRLWEKTKITPSFILKHLLELQIYHNIKVLFCGNVSNAEKLAETILKKVHYIEKVQQKNI
jgi:ERCC4-type nuclease